MKMSSTPNLRLLRLLHRRLLLRQPRLREVRIRGPHRPAT
jgi:hypothetical protein